MKHKIRLGALMFTLPNENTSDPMTTVSSLRTRFNPSLLGVPLEQPRLQWTLKSEEATSRQVGYQIRYRRDHLAEWTIAQPIASTVSIAIEAPGGQLKAREVREYAVRIATDAGWTPWSEPFIVEGGLDPDSLTAQVIGIPTEVEGPAASLRREFSLDFEPMRARLYVSALGLVHPRINGHAASDTYLTPGWTEYRERVLVDTYDVTKLLKRGENAISLLVGDGWYRGRMGFAGRTEIYGNQSGAIAQLEIEGANGEALTLITDQTWHGGFGAIQSASIYDGTMIDLRKDTGDPSLPGFNETEWAPVCIIDSDRRIFEPRPVPGVHEIATFPMSIVSGDVSDATLPVILDAQQNVSGWVRLKVSGQPGARITVRHAEILEADGSLHTASLRTAKATDTYILGESGTVELEPILTFHGFRYAEVTGPVSIAEATAVAISTHLQRRGTLTTSHQTLNRFHENVVWSQADNFVSVPTDCPQRDERLGWTGDAQAFAATANTLFHTEAFWMSWLRDLELDQPEDGSVASVVPNIISGDASMGNNEINDMGRAGWADAATIVPWATYISTGSPLVLISQLDSMRRWVDHLRTRADAHTLLPEEPFQYGDWLDPDAPAAQPWNAKTDPLFVANSFYVHSARILAETEALVGDQRKAREYADLADRVAFETWKRWRHEAHETQTGAAMCLEFDIVPDDERAELADSLATNVRAEHGRIATGFLGTPLILFALSHANKWEEAYMMLLRRDPPSWLYQVDRGATTVWERWDAIKADGSIHAGDMEGDGNGMISFNHYAYGAMIDWVYRNVAGMEPIEAGYARTRIGPRPSSAVTRASASIETHFGMLSINWHLVDDSLEVSLDVPFGVTAQLDLPLTEDSQLTINGAAASTSSTTLRHGHYTITASRVSVIHVDAAAS
ncbi:alpha-L-rhamnosidase [Schaalia sp. ZJ1691]|uniref:alpha-L-rhamnosidase n=1 Tax=Schaalia sp. ZJ1691 TaxID=2709404 RepID=UPI0013EB63B3|nr:alpha-L-rhamnosidase [Schaalia sp. ZJ1691]